MLPRCVRSLDVRCAPPPPPRRASNGSPTACTLKVALDIAKGMHYLYTCVTRRRACGLFLLKCTKIYFRLGVSENHVAAPEIRIQFCQNPDVKTGTRAVHVAVVLAGQNTASSSSELILSVHYY